MRFERQTARYPFVLADESGKILLESPNGICHGGNIFSKVNISGEDADFIGKQLLGGSYHRAIALKNAESGKLWLFSNELFPSTRIFAAIITDIDFDMALPIIENSFRSIAVNSPEKGRIMRKHEKLYPEISDAVCAFNAAFSKIENGRGFSEVMLERIKAVSVLSGCVPEIEELKLSQPIPDNFDGGLFTLFLFVSLFSASMLSNDRKGRITVLGGLSSVTARVSFKQNNGNKMKNWDVMQTEKRIKKILEYMRSVCEKNNIPFSIISDENCAFEIKPLRPEVSYLGLKHPKATLIDKDQQK